MGKIIGVLRLSAFFKHLMHLHLLVSEKSVFWKQLENWVMWIYLPGLIPQKSGETEEE